MAKFPRPPWGKPVPISRPSPQRSPAHGGDGSAPPPEGGHKAFWASPQETMIWQAAPGGGTYITGGYATGLMQEAAKLSPLFDLRADLGDRTGFQAEAYSIENVLFGVALDLFFDIFIDSFSLFQGYYRFFLVEFGSAVEPRLGTINEVGAGPAQFSNVTDVTAAVTAGSLPPTGDLRSILRVRPTGPLRYWGCGFVAGWYEPLAPNPSPILISGALH